MKTELSVFAVIFSSLLGSVPSIAQFSSGSDGSYGALNVTSNMTLDLPPDGIFHCTTITVGPNAILTFNRNSLNTPVYLLATGDVSIAGSGTIDVSGSAGFGSTVGRGGPGGFDGGFAAFQGFPAGDGQGPGGGRAAVFAYGAAFATTAANGANTNAYGNTLLSPLIGGSGGSAGNGGSGGGGGGAIVVASSSKVSFGLGGIIRANGGAAAAPVNTFCGAGSGGAIRIVAPIVEGGGQLLADAGGRNNQPPNTGSPGRTRIDSLDRFAHRSITLGGIGTRGSQMFVFPPGNPRLDVVHAAGTDIPEGTGVPVMINLPLGSDTNQIVRVQARNFTNDVPIRVRVTPENAPSMVFDGEIPQSSGTPPFANVSISLPLDTVCYIQAWTR